MVKSITHNTPQGGRVKTKNHRTEQPCHTEGVGHNIAGQVTGLNNIGDCPGFQWTVCLYNYRLGGQPSQWCIMW